MIGSGCKERYFFRARRKNAVVLLVLQRTANVQRCRAGGIEEVADVCACGSMLEHIIHTIGPSCLVVGQTNLVPVIACSLVFLDASATVMQARCLLRHARLDLELVLCAGISTRNNLAGLSLHSRPISPTCCL